MQHLPGGEKSSYFCLPKCGAVTLLRDTVFIQGAHLLCGPPDLPVTTEATLSWEEGGTHILAMEVTF